MTGLNRKQSMQALIFRRRFILFAITLSILPFFIDGCDRMVWTDFDFYNFSNKRLYVKVIGISPDVSPGALVPNEIGQNEAVKSASFAEPANFDDTIRIEWTIDKGGKKYVKEYKRDDLGIPSVVRGGRIKFVYTETGEWEIDY